MKCVFIKILEEDIDCMDDSVLVLDSNIEICNLYGVNFIKVSGESADKDSVEIKKYLKK